MEKLKPQLLTTRTGSHEREWERGRFCLKKKVSSRQSDDLGRAIYLNGGESNRALGWKSAHKFESASILQDQFGERSKERRQSVRAGTDRLKRGGGR